MGEVQDIWVCVGRDFWRQWGSTRAKGKRGGRGRGDKERNKRVCERGSVAAAYLAEEHRANTETSVRREHAERHDVQFALFHPAAGGTHQHIVEEGELRESATLRQLRVEGVRVADREESEVERTKLLHALLAHAAKLDITRCRRAARRLLFHRPPLVLPAIPRGRLYTACSY
eukprot:scaffold308764_cov39-Tisochrysis_lutea.AAC.2